MNVHSSGKCGILGLVVFKLYGNSISYLAVMPCVPLHKTAECEVVSGQNFGNKKKIDPQLVINSMA
jgi:hypothetical protein